MAGHGCLGQWEPGKKGYTLTLTCKATVAGWSGGVGNTPSNLKKGLQAIGIKTELDVL